MERDVTGGISLPLDIVPSLSPLASPPSASYVLRDPQPVDPLGVTSGSGMLEFGCTSPQAVASLGNTTVSLGPGGLPDVLPVWPVRPWDDSFGVPLDRSVDSPVGAANFSLPASSSSSPGRGAKLFDPLGIPIP